MPRLLAALGGLERSSRGGRLVERPVSQFRWLAFPAALLLLFERVRLRRGRRRETGTARLRTESRAAAAAVLLLFLVAPRADAQSAWARGDRAFKEGKFTEAESLYTIRLKGGGPSAVQLNRATARALKGDLKGAVPELETLGRRDDEAGRGANYNLGTLLGGQREYDPALQSLRRALEQNPQDEDARWNYELLIQRRDQERRRKQPPQPQPNPKQGGQKPEPRQQGSGSGTPPPQGTPEQRPPQAPQSGQKMTRQQAEQILNALEDLARMEQQRQRKVRVLKERRGRDW
jgi:tetratricopeptide (TPR) repeat protein